MGRSMLLGFAGPGQISQAAVKDVMDDYLEGLPEEIDDVRVVIPAADKYLTKTVLLALDWTDSAKLKYEAVYDVETDDNEMILNESDKEIEARNVGAGLIDRLAKVVKDGDEARLIVAWGEDGDVQTEMLVELAEARKLKVLDITAGLDDHQAKLEELVLGEAPEPEPEPKSRRSRRTAKTAEAAPEEDKPRPRRGKPREQAEEPVEAAESAEPESVEAEVSLARQKAQRATQAPAKDDVVLTALLQSFELVTGLDVCHAAMTLKDDREPSALYVLLGQAIDKYTESFVAQPDDKPAETPARRGGRPRKDGSAAQPRSARQRGRKEVYDEDKGQWVPAGRGRISKTAKTRLVDPKTDEVIEED